MEQGKGVLGPASMAAEEITQTMPVGLLTFEWVDDADGLRLLGANPAGERLAGLPPGGASGQPVDLLFPALRRQGLLRALERTTRTGEGFEAPEIRLRLDEGRYFSVRAFGLPGGRAGLTLEDATERRQIDEAMLQLSWEAEAANRAKGLFLANMSHELRTPLNAIIGYAELVAEDAEELGASSLAPDLTRIRSSARYLLGLIEDVLDLAKIEAGRFGVVPEACPVAWIVNEAAESIYPALGPRGNTLALAISPDLPRVLADPMRLRQVLINLLSNACKFTAHGHIVVSASEAARQGRAGIAIAVRDDGIGIGEAQRERLFTAFTQADATTTRKYGGTGLGLALSRRLCRLMNGDLAVESQAGAGATFTAWLPVAAGD